MCLIFCDVVGLAMLNIPGFIQSENRRIPSGSLDLLLGIDSQPFIE